MNKILLRGGVNRKLSKIFIKKHQFGAGKWIYEGYYNAWKDLDHEPIFYNTLEEINPSDQDLLMAIDGDIRTGKDLNIIASAGGVFLYVQPNWFPDPWGRHANWICHCPEELIYQLNKLKTVIKWTFGSSSEYHTKWEKVNSVPLAFDDIAYEPEEDKGYAYEVCYIGGWANNGFNEKARYLLECKQAFERSALKAGIFIDQNLSHQEECNILYNSTVAINIHDEYQKALQLDTNERTFKALGLTGILISDKIKAISKLQLPVTMTESVEELIDKIKDYIYIHDTEDIAREKRHVRRMIKENHTYKNRIKQLLELL